MLAEKINRYATLPKLTGESRCIVSKATATVVDTIDAEGLTHCFGRTFDEIRLRYPDAEIMTLDAFCAWKGERQRTPIAWEATTEERYWEMLGCLPPETMAGGGFLVGEPWDHCALTGAPRFQAFRERGGRFEVASRPMTRAEFRDAVRA